MLFGTAEGMWHKTVHMQVPYYKIYITLRLSTAECVHRSYVYKQSWL